MVFSYLYKMLCLWEINADALYVLGELFYLRCIFFSSTFHVSCLVCELRGGIICVTLSACNPFHAKALILLRPLCVNRKFHLNIGRSSFTVREGCTWHWLPRDVGKSPSLHLFKCRLDKALNSHSSWLCFDQGCWSRWSPEITSSLNSSAILCYPVQLNRNLLSEL